MIRRYGLEEPICELTAPNLHTCFCNVTTTDCFHVCQQVVVSHNHQSVLDHIIDEVIKTSKNYVVPIKMFNSNNFRRTSHQNKNLVI